MLCSEPRTESAPLETSEFAQSGVCSVQIDRLQTTAFSASATLQKFQIVAPSNRHLSFVKDRLGRSLTTLVLANAQEV